MLDLSVALGFYKSPIPNSGHYWLFRIFYCFGYLTCKILSIFSGVHVANHQIGKDQVCSGLLPALVGRNFCLPNSLLLLRIVRRQVEAAGQLDHGVDLEVQDLN